MPCSSALRGKRPSTTSPPTTPASSRAARSRSRWRRSRRPISFRRERYARRSPVAPRAPSSAPRTDTRTRWHARCWTRRSRASRRAARPTRPSPSSCSSPASASGSTATPCTPPPRRSTASPTGCAGPRQTVGSGSGSRARRRRIGKMVEEFDGLRIDHPHGLIDPWVYRAAQPDPQLAVQHGTRLFSSPDLPDLARFAVARSEQLDRAARRYSDGWVRSLSDEQVARYAVLFDAVVDAARAHGRAVDDLLCEVLSTQPYPVERVLARHGLGRFRVTQKVVLGDPADVYRSENAAPVDWIMAGTHDTEPVWRVAERWVAGGSATAHAAYLAQRLVD